AVRLREIQDSIVTFIPVFQGPPNLGPGGPWFQAKKSVREVVADIIVLRREIVRLWFSLLADELSLPGALVHVMRNRSHVIEELGIHRPPLVFAPDFRTDQRGSTFGHGLLQGKPLVTGHRVAEAFIRSPVFVSGRG